jgi:hypothetical protein
MPQRPPRQRLSSNAQVSTRQSYSRVVGYSSMATIGLRPPPDDVGRQKGCKVRIARYTPESKGWRTPDASGVLAEFYKKGC